MLFVRAYPRETQEMVFDAHDRAFALFKGTCSGLSAAVFWIRAASHQCAGTSIPSAM
jgi:hypothetical protein